MRRVKASKGVKTLWLSENETDLIIFCPYRCKDGAEKGVLEGAKVVDFETVLGVEEGFGDAEFSAWSITDGNELAR